MIKRLRSSLPLAAFLAIGMPVLAQQQSLSDARQPGSVIVFPKFIPGVQPLPEGGTVPATEIKYTIVCPPGQRCDLGTSLTVRFHWVCPGETVFTEFVCKDTSFEVTSRINEKVVLIPDGSFPGVSTRVVPAAPCVGATNPAGRGYLIGFVIEPSTGAPVKFDGLIGEAVLRESGAALSAYGAIPIQADSQMPTFPASGSAVTTVGGALAFDGGTGHYEAVAGKIRGDVKFSNTAGPSTFTTGFLTLLTLDVQSNRPNNPVFVDLDFYGAVDGDPAFFLSTFTAFVCWTEQRIDVIDENLTQAFFGRDGSLVSGSATKVLYFPSDGYGPVGLLGLFESIEGPTAGAAMRAYITPFFSDGVSVTTSFVP